MNIDKSIELNNKGLSSFENGDVKKAANILKNSYRLWSDNKGILVNLGLSLMQQGRHLEAQKCYEIAYGLFLS